MSIPLFHWISPKLYLGPRIDFYNQINAKQLSYRKLGFPPFFAPTFPFFSGKTLQSNVHFARCHVFGILIPRKHFFFAMQYFFRIFFSLENSIMRICVSSVYICMILVIYFYVCITFFLMTWHILTNIWHFRRSNLYRYKKLFKCFIFHLLQCALPNQPCTKNLRTVEWPLALDGHRNGIKFRDIHYGQM